MNDNKESISVSARIDSIVKIIREVSKILRHKYLDPDEKTTIITSTFSEYLTFKTDYALPNKYDKRKIKNEAFSLIYELAYLDLVNNGSPVFPPIVKWLESHLKKIILSFDKMSPEFWQESIRCRAINDPIAFVLEVLKDIKNNKIKLSNEHLNNKQWVIDYLKRAIRDGRRDILQSLEQKKVKELEDRQALKLPSSRLKILFGYGTEMIIKNMKMEEVEQSLAQKIDESQFNELFSRENTFPCFIYLKSEKDLYSTIWICRSNDTDEWKRIDDIMEDNKNMFHVSKAKFMAYLKCLFDSTLTYSIGFLNCSTAARVKILDTNDLTQFSHYMKSVKIIFSLIERFLGIAPSFNIEVKERAKSSLKTYPEHEYFIPVKIVIIKNYL